MKHELAYLGSWLQNKITFKINVSISHFVRLKQMSKFKGFFFGKDCRKGELKCVLEATQSPQSFNSA